VSKSERLGALRAEIEAQHAAAAEKQATRNKRGARERVLALLDEGSFDELDPFVQHRASQFGMDRSRPYGDGVNETRPASSRWSSRASWMVISH